MKLIVGEDVLKESSVTGKGNWNPIPENIYEGVFGNIYIITYKRGYAQTCGRGHTPNNKLTLKHSWTHSDTHFIHPVTRTYLFLSLTPFF